GPADQPGRRPPTADRSEAVAGTRIALPPPRPGRAVRRDRVYPPRIIRESVMSLDSLHDLYVNELRDLYNAENQLLKALPRMAKAASDPGLRAAFEEHLAVTRGQVERLDRIFKRLGERATGKKCVAMEGLI